MRLRETTADEIQRDKWRPMGTHETQRDYWRPMGTQETQRD